MNEQNRQRKAEALDYLRESLAKCSIMIITDYRGENKGLTVKAITELRHQLREQNGVYKIAKNTLIRKALKEINVELEESLLEGPTAVVFGFGDPAAAAKAVLEFAKNQKPTKLPIVKGAVMEGRFVSIKELEAIAELPSICSAHADPRPYAGAASQYPWRLKRRRTQYGYLVRCLEQETLRGSRSLKA